MQVSRLSQVMADRGIKPAPFTLTVETIIIPNVRKTKQNYNSDKTLAEQLADTD